MQGKKPKKTFTISYEAIEILKSLSAGNESYLVEKLIKDEKERRELQGAKAS